MSSEHDPIERIRASKHFQLVDALIRCLRANASRMVTARELAATIGCRKGQVYGVIKIARLYLSLTSGEFIPNLRRIGYRITFEPRAALFESVKSGRRADGHLAQEAITFSRINRDQLKSIEDVELYVQQQAIVHLGQARLAMSRDMKALMERHAKNLALSSTATNEASTPWEALGLTDPAAESN